MTNNRTIGVASLLLGLALLLSLAWVPAGSAQDEPASIRLIRVMEADETGLPNPAGLAFSNRANAFYVAGAPVQGQALPSSTEIITLTPYAERAGSARLAAQVKDPLNLALDAKGNRLLILQGANRLLEVPEAGGGGLEAQGLRGREVGDLGLQEPRGMSVDPGSGRIFILDGVGPRLVVVEPQADGSLGQVQVTEVELGALGLGEVRGLALDPGTGHLQVMSLGDQGLYELSQTGEVVARRDLAEFNLLNPQGMVLAPSSDQTDAAEELSLFIADGGDGAAQMPGGIYEFSFSAPVAPAAADFQSSIVRIAELAAISPPSPDPSGLTYVPDGNKLMMVDGEVEETVSGITHWQGANVWELTLVGGVLDTGNVSKKSGSPVPMTDEPVGIAWNPNNGHYFVSSDSSKDVFDLDPGADGMPGTNSDSWTTFDTLVYGNGDPEGITFDSWNNTLFVADGVNAEVYHYTLTGSLLGHFDVQRYGVEDPETVDFNPDSGTLFVMSSNRTTPVIVETTLDGTLLQTINISATNARQAAGLAYAPASNGSGAKRFYIVDRGIDNNSDPKIVDGKLFEMTAPASGPPVEQPPVANDDNASTTPGTAVNINVAANDTDPNGNLDPSSATATDPPNGSVGPNNGNGIFSYTPDPGFTGTDSFTYEICDTAALCDTATVSISVAAVTDLIFSDGFESGNLSAWTANSNDLGDLSVSALAALVGSNGMQALLDDNVAIYVTSDTPNAEPRYRARFYFDPNSIPMANNENHFIFYGYTGTTPAVLRVQFRFRNGSYQLRAGLRDDGSTWRNTPWANIGDAVHWVELDWRAATAAGANDGGLTFWIDGVQQAPIGGVDNDTRRIDRVRLGAVGGIDSGTRGTYYFDAFESRRQTEIGP